MDMGGTILVIVLCGLVMFAVYWATKKDTEKKLQEDQREAAANPVKVSMDFGYTDHENKWHSGVPNSADGWELSGTLRNRTDRCINYIHLYVYPVDAIGTKRASAKHLLFTGPFEAHKESGISTRPIWYDIPVQNVVLQRYKVQFSDGYWQTRGPVGNLVKYTCSVGSVSVILGHHDAQGKWVNGGASPSEARSILCNMEYNGTKTVTKLTLRVTPYDMDDEALAAPKDCFIKGQFLPGKFQSFSWKDLWENGDVDHVKLNKIVFDYEDGTNLEVNCT